MAGVKTFEDLDAWRLSVDLRDRVVELTAGRLVARDVAFCDQIRDSARSAPRNIAEGFGAFRPREFARFARIARRSLHETKNHLLEARKCGYLTEPAADELLRLCSRALGATTGLLRYLEACDGQAPVDWSARGEP
jgi:four helix bundle protein